MKILRVGSAAVLASYDSLEEVVAHHRTVEQARPDGVVDLVPAARTMLVRYDPRATDAPTVARALRAVPPDDRGLQARSDHPLEVPVVYDGEDLPEVSAATGLPRDEVIAAHTGGPWTVAFCGFSPGFGYLAGGDPRLAVPRRATPRTRVPAGGVALAGEFSAVYPRASPGGWQLIGRTDLAVFDPDRDPPALLTPGRTVRFVQVGP